MKKIIDWLNKPFPFTKSIREILLMSFLFGFFIFAFLIIFQPFNIHEIKSSKSLYVFGFSIITFVIVLVNLMFTPRIFKSIFNSNNWMIKKEILLTLLIIVSIALFNWIYIVIFEDYFSPDRPGNLISFLFYTIVIGIFPITFSIFIRDKFIVRKQNNSDSESDKSISEDIVKIISKSNLGFIEIDLQKLLCINSNGNYAIIYFEENSEVIKRDIYNSLENINKQLEMFEYIKRCHRSHIINLNKVIKVSGNSRNYNLHFEKLDFSIPVSRSFPKSYIKNLQNKNSISHSN